MSYLTTFFFIYRPIFFIFIYIFSLSSFTLFIHFMTLGRYFSIFRKPGHWPETAEFFNSPTKNGMSDTPNSKGWTCEKGVKIKNATSPIQILFMLEKGKSPLCSVYSKIEKKLLVPWVLHLQVRLYHFHFRQKCSHEKSWHKNPLSPRENLKKSSFYNITDLTVSPILRAWTIPLKSNKSFYPWNDCFSLY